MTSSQQSNLDLTLWYDRPAAVEGLDDEQQWLRAIPLGNGRIGAMVYGDPLHERVQLNEDTLYALEPETAGHIPPFKENADRICELVKQGRYRDAECALRRFGRGRSNAPYQPMGDLLIDFHGEGVASEYRRSLGLREAVARMSYVLGGVRYDREVFVSYPAQVLALRMTVDKPGALSFTARLDTPHKPAAATATADDETLVLDAQGPGEAFRRAHKWVRRFRDHGKYPALYRREGRTYKPIHEGSVLYADEVGGRGMYFQMRLRAIATGGEVSTSDDRIEVKGADEVVLLLSADTSFNGFDKSPSTEGVDPSVQASADIDAASAKTFTELRQEHVADYRALFERVDIELGARTERSQQPTDERIARYAEGNDPTLPALYYQFARYLMIAGSRHGTQPLNLQGIWNRKIIPPWNCGYTVNINAEMNYWDVERGNLSECHEPLLRMIQDAHANGARVAREMFGFRGWCMFHNISIWRACAPVDGFPRTSWWPMAAGWLCQHVWRHYQFTMDRAFLKEMYPALKGAAEFFSDWLADRGDGVLVTPVSTSPENGFFYVDDRGRRVNGCVTMGCTMDMAIIRETFRHCIEAAETLDVDDELAAELKSKLPDLLWYQSGKHGQLLEWDKDFDERQVEHRHLSHLYGLFPGDELTPEKTPDLMPAVARTLERRGDGATGWSMGWKLCIQARMQNSGKFMKLMRGLLTPEHTAHNMFDLHPPFQIDGNFGASRGITETLLQDHRDCIHLLPTLPAEWPDGSVRGLRARGGFEVDISWSGGALVEAKIRSAAGMACKVRYGEDAIQVELGAGEERALRPFSFSQ